MNRVYLMLGLLLAANSTAVAQEPPFLVKRQEILDEKAVIATVESVREVQARSRINGTITALFVKEGDALSAGDKIAAIGDQKLVLRGKGFEARLQAAQSSLEKARLDFQRAEELRKTGYGTQAKLDEARNNLDIATNALRLAEAEKQESAEQTSEGIVLAPGPGRVLRVPVAVGSVIMAGETVATLSQEDYVLRLELPERHARYLKPGDKVFVGDRGLSSGGKGELKTGTVRLVYPAIKGGRVVADATVPELGDYFVGERTLVYIATGRREAFVVPDDYIFKRGSVTFARLKNGSDVVVQTGQSKNGNVEILSGLVDGDEVVKP